MQLSAFPRVALAALPTPLEPLPRLSRHLGGPDVYIKRDDNTGLAIGGNKTRKLEFLLADAIERGCDTVVTAGATQSNHVRQTAAACARLGLPCEVLLERRVADKGVDYDHNGNVLLDALLGATVHHRPPVEDLDAETESFVAELAADGRNPYFVPVGGSNRVGALGYVVCAREIINQAFDRGLTIDHVIVATGSAGTQAGLVAGFESAGATVPVTGVCVSRPEALMVAKVEALLRETWSFLELRGDPPGGLVAAEDGFIGPGYGVPTDAMVEAVNLFARLEGVLLDPVYTGKAAAGLIALIREGRFRQGETLVFVHTGGTPALFAYRGAFQAG